MNAYEIVKLIHVVGASVLFGMGMGIAFFMLRAHMLGEAKGFLATSRSVVVADSLFTAPAVVVQFASGLWLTTELGLAYTSVWFIAVVGLFVLVGLCWLPVVWIQWRLSRLSAAEHGGAEYRRLIRAWIALGIPAFLAVLAIFWLMVAKAGMGVVLL